MWKRFIEYVLCPVCKSELHLMVLDGRKILLEKEDYADGDSMGIKPDALNEYVETGLLLCKNCNSWYPILHGLPVLLPYETPIVREFIGKHNDFIAKVAKGYKNPAEVPKPGETFVLKSFSKEWLEYEYDGVIWGWSYEDREKTLLAEIGIPMGIIKGIKYLEIGCGLGITTNFARENYRADAVGVDLSLAVIKATDHFRKNPFMHFVQGTLFQLPLKQNHFDIVYSHGVLHHTYSTKEAFKAISAHCKKGGRTYIWLYGKGGQTNSWDRKLGHYAETLLRPFLSRIPTVVSTVMLAPIALGYIFLNSILRHNNPTLQSYNLKRAFHAARDRFTPRFAYRHNYEEVETWFKEFGFNNIQELDWRDVPSSVHSLFRGAVGVRGQRKTV